MNAHSKPFGRFSFAGSLAGIAVAALAANAQHVSAAGMDLLPGTLITTLDYLDSGTTVGALDDVAGTFSGYFQKGSDVFYSFNVLTSGNMTFVVTPAPGYDPGIGLFQGTMASPGWVLGGSVDANLSGGNETLLDIPVLAGQTYYFVIDSNFLATDPKGEGAYSLKVTGSNGVMVPEPGSALLLGIGAVVLGWRRRRVV